MASKSSKWRGNRPRLHPVPVRCPSCARVLGFRRKGCDGTWCCRDCRVDVVVEVDGTVLQVQLEGNGGE